MPCNFFVSLVEFQHTPEAFEAVEYWPNGFLDTPGVILRRDVAFAQTSKPHRVGAIQSFSYWPYPRCNRSMHEKVQSDWTTEQQVKISRTLDAIYYDTYYFHYRSVSDVMHGKPWGLGGLQLRSDTRTLYLGGCASYETVEDSLQYNLQLVHELFDSDSYE